MQINFARAATLLEAHPGRRNCHYICDDGPWITHPPQWCYAPCRPDSVYCREHYRACHAGKRWPIEAAAPGAG